MKKIKKQYIIYAVIAIIILIIVYYNFIYEKDYLEEKTDLNNAILDISTNTINNGTDFENNNNINQLENNENKIKIHITGAVQKPGIYELNKNSRIADAIEQAGGITEQAYLDKINLAYILDDGMKIYIPNKNEDLNLITDKTKAYISLKSDEITTTTNGETTQKVDQAGIISNGKNNENSKNNKKSKKININLATKEELQELPGIGESTAIKIVNYRKENGKFSNVEDLKNVKGIGNAKFEKIKDLIYV